MKHTDLISEMMSLNFKSRVWHWQTPQAQHHITYEQFLTQNEGLMDRYVESALGNDLELALTDIKLSINLNESYDIASTRKQIKTYRNNIAQHKTTLEKSEADSSSELMTILDDATELCSKTLYLLKLS